MKRPETTGADISTPDKAEEIISLLDEYIDSLEIDKEILMRLARKRARIMNEWIERYNLPIGKAVLD